MVRHLGALLRVWSMNTADYNRARDAIALSTMANAYADTINAGDIDTAYDSADSLRHLLGELDTRKNLQDVLDVDYTDLALALGYVAALADALREGN